MEILIEKKEKPTVLVHRDRTYSEKERQADDRQTERKIKRKAVRKRQRQINR